MPLLVWQPMPEERGNVWRAKLGSYKAYVARQEEGHNIFMGQLNGLIVGQWGSPMQAMEGIERILQQRLQ